MGSKKDIVIRFAVGEPNGDVSSVWRVWFNKLGDNSTSDVYLSYRYLGGVQKVSIHESGSIQYSFTGEYAREKGIPNKDRHKDKWKLQGKYPLFRIIVPFTELKLADTAANYKKVKYIQNPSYGCAIEIFLYITTGKLSSKPPYNMFEEHILNNGNVLSLLWRENIITDENRNLYETAKKELLEILPKNMFPQNKIVRGAFFLNSGENQRGFIDISLQI